MKDVRERDVIDVVEGAPGVFAPTGVRVYVAGEHVPERGSERGVAGEERALVPARELSTDDVLWAFREWMRLEVAEGQGSAATIKAYLGDVRQHFAWLRDEGAIGGMEDLASVGEEEIKGYRAHLVERYAASTAGRKLVSVRRFYAMAQARGLLGHNPAAGVKSPRDRTSRHERVRYLTAAEVQAALKAPQRNTPKGIRDRAILTLMAYHGPRVVELHRLNLEDVDLEAGEAGEVRVLGKGDKARTILLVEETREALREWLAVRNLTRSGSQAVFLALHWGGGGMGEREAAGAGRMSRRGIRMMVDGYLEAVGAKREGVSCHAFRHSFATLSLAAGAGLMAISEAMGHSSVTVTQVYAKIVDKARNNPAKFLVGVY